MKKKKKKKTITGRYSPPFVVSGVDFCHGE